MPCSACGRGFHDECYTQCNSCHPQAEHSLNLLPETEQSYKDRRSTGRKRAAVMYPIVCRNCNNPTTKTRKDQTVCTCGSRTTDACEWQGKKNCGGGSVAIVGCPDGRQVDRHHGPIKDPMVNEVGNVHRICQKCHQRYHHLNDENWSDSPPHMPESATVEEIFENELRWETGWFKEHYNLKSNKPMVMED